MANKLSSRDLTISIRLDKLAVNGKAPMFYLIHGSENRIISRVISPYRFLPYDFIGRLDKPSRRILENQCIKEEIYYFERLCRMHPDNPQKVVKLFKAYINDRDEI